MKINLLLAATGLFLSTMTFGVTSPKILAADPTLAETHKFIDKMIKESVATVSLPDSLFAKWEIASYDYSGCKVTIGTGYERVRNSLSKKYEQTFDVAQLSQIDRFYSEIIITGRIEHQVIQIGVKDLSPTRDLRIQFDSDARSERVWRAFQHLLKLCFPKDPF